MTLSSPITFCLSTYNNLPYLKIAVDSVRNNSFFSNAPFIVHAENCTDGTNEWLFANRDKYNLTLLVEPKTIQVRGIGGGMNVCADHAETEYIMFLHSDFYVTKDWDIEALKLFEKYPNEKLWISSHRVEPNMFNNPHSRPGTVIVPPDYFGAYHDNFNQQVFEDWADEFKQLNPDIEIPKGEGVSGLIRKVDWDYVGGNDPLFAPASYDDMDLFLRMLIKGYRFILTSNSLVWHFGARGSHRLEENNGQTSQRQQEAEQKNIQKWLDKWGKMPTFDQYGMIRYEA
ncbi:MAG: glycosyltransferase family 2 protein [Proteobacteria bacterium]|nr:glycosyltransferase family 2 protein [Pseudomonadota bacterium]